MKILLVHYRNISSRILLTKVLNEKMALEMIVHPRVKPAVVLVKNFAKDIISIFS
jgi:hypothetical protein